MNRRRHCYHDDDKGPTVEVVGFQKYKGAPTELHASPYVLNTIGWPSGTVFTWQIPTEGYRFDIDSPKNAIVFTSPGSDEFFSSSWVSSDGKEAYVTYTNNAEDRGAYAYLITALAPDGHRVVLDPVVQNQGN
jgi:hypothetical protein